MKHRSPLAVFFLSIITLGIYDLYWLVKTKQVLNAKTSQHTPTIWLLVVPFVLVIAGYVLFFATIGVHTTTTTYSTTNTGFAASQNTPASTSSAAFGPFALIFFGFLAAFVIGIVWFFKFSKAVNEYTRGKMSTAVSFLTLWLVHLIGVALIQDVFNEMAGEAAGAASPGAPVTPATPETSNQFNNYQAPNPTPAPPPNPVASMPPANSTPQPQPQPPQPQNPDFNQTKYPQV